MGITKTRKQTLRWLAQKQRAYKSKKSGNIPYRDWVYTIGKRMPYKGGYFNRETKQP